MAEADWQCQQEVKKDSLLFIQFNRTTRERDVCDQSSESMATHPWPGGSPYATDTIMRWLL